VKSHLIVLLPLALNQHPGLHECGRSVLLIVAVVDNWFTTNVILCLTLIPIVCIGWIFLYPIYNRWELRRASKKFYSQDDLQDILGEHSLEFTTDEMIVTIKNSEERYKRSKVKGISEDDSSIDIYVSLEKALIVPRRAFSASYEFVQGIKRYIERAYD